LDAVPLLVGRCDVTAPAHRELGEFEKLPGALALAAERPQERPRAAVERRRGSDDGGDDDDDGDGDDDGGDGDGSDDRDGGDGDGGDDVKDAGR
jgi:hypothetical protein